jgi:hypothetical protein
LTLDHPIQDLKMPSSVGKKLGIARVIGVLYRQNLRREARVFLPKEVDEFFLCLRGPDYQNLTYIGERDGYFLEEVRLFWSFMTTARCLANVGTLVLLVRLHD